jgi:hypothetical protein
MAFKPFSKKMAGGKKPAGKPMFGSKKMGRGC